MGTQTQWSVQRRDTSEYWCDGAWRTTQEWFARDQVDEVFRAWPELPLSLSSRRVCDSDDEPPLRKCSDCALNLGRDVLRALGSCPRWGQPRHGAESHCPAFVAKDGAR